MTMRRFLIAAGVLLGLVYLRLLMPEGTTLVEALRSMTAYDQVLLHLPEGAAAWLLWS